METLTIKKMPSDALLRAAARALKDGKVIVFPTDTIYGIVGDASNERVLRIIYAIKERPRGKPFPILVPTLARARRYALISPRTKSHLKKYWPGPVTAILPSRRGLPPLAVSNDRKIALRVPRAPRMQKLLRASNLPLAATSVNISGNTHENNPKRIISLFRRHAPAPAFLFDFGKLPHRKPSRIIDFTSPSPKVVRR